jgi:hypothetical protein
MSAYDKKCLGHSATSRYVIDSPTHSWSCFTGDYQSPVNMDELIRKARWDGEVRKEKVERGKTKKKEEMISTIESKRNNFRLAHGPPGLRHNNASHL